MTVTPTGILSLPLDNARTLIANSATWQNWVGAADADAAKEHIHIAGPPPPSGEYFSDAEMNNLWPLCVLALPPDGQGFAVRREGDGTDLVMPQRGMVMAMFEDGVDGENENSPGDAEFAFLNEIGGVLGDMLDLAGTGDGTNQYLWLRGASINRGPMREDINEQERPHHWILIDLPWGFGGGAA